jgi:hypothetical protein
VTPETEDHAQCQRAFDAINRSMDDLSHNFIQFLCQVCSGIQRYTMNGILFCFQKFPELQILKVSMIRKIERGRKFQEIVKKVTSVTSEFAGLSAQGFPQVRVTLSR